MKQPRLILSSFRRGVPRSGDNALIGLGVQIVNDGLRNAPTRYSK